MAGFKNGIIKLDSAREVFYPQQAVSGNVIFETDQPFTLSALYVTFLGEATVDWTETESEEYNGEKRYKDIEYVGRDEYFNVNVLLAGGNSPVNLPPGTHTFPFNYVLPSGIPSSFTGDRGGVSYCVKATIQHFVKDELIKSFKVVAPFDLNLGSPQLKEPIDLEFEEVYSCGCFCSSDPVTIRIRLPASGYCPGQIIPVALEVHNQSSVEISKIIFQILSRERYRTQHPVSEYVPPEQVLATVKKGSVMSGTKRSLTVDVPVPELIAVNLENCSIIDVGYFFRAIIKLSGCNDDLEDEAEICLGLVPLNETLDGEYTHPLAHSLPLGPIPDIPAPIPEQARQQEVIQSQAYPGYPHPTQTGSYFVQVQQQYTSSDPSKNYNIGFTMTSPPGSDPAQMLRGFPGQNWAMPQLPHPGMKIHLPPPGVNIHTPSAPPPSS